MKYELFETYLRMRPETKDDLLYLQDEYPHIRPSPAVCIPIMPDIKRVTSLDLMKERLERRMSRI